MLEVNLADTTFVFLASVLVMLMTPGLALFYGGMVRQKNVLSTTMHSYTALAIISIQWVFIGYTLAFGSDVFGIIGGLEHFFLNGVGFEPNAAYSSTIPEQLFMLFQLKFAILTPALISGAFAERMTFKSFIAFLLLWTTFAYDPLAHWVWGDGGWLRQLGALDFAGGNVVHISSGVSALVLALFLGKRKNIQSAHPHHLPMMILGGGILWFGWFGFNAGSALAINNVAISAFMTTNTAAAAGALGWMAIEWKLKGKPSVVGFMTGALAGLVSITPAAGYVSVGSALIIGVFAALICYFTINVLKQKFGYDDALDAFGCHGIGGIWGGIATGLFASTQINAAGADGLFYGNYTLLIKQLIAIAATVGYSLVVTFLIIWIISKFMKVRVSDSEEEIGLDLTQHGETAYNEFQVPNEVTA
ncbi:MAG TPA: ammonia channel protein [Firmicutes bacterium]|nr:ammonia channel protein [Bacillota bacterium]